MRTPVAERFWRLVNKAGPDECWLWTGAQVAGGYGVFWFNGGGRTSNRVAWILTNGQIPNGLHVLHRCDVPACCNPAHLFVGTRSENMRDMQRKGRANYVRGERHGVAKLTAETVSQIKAMAGERSQAQIAALFDVSQSTVWRTLHGETFASVT